MVDTSLDQAVALLGAFASTFSFALPERRPPDPITSAHLRAAERVHAVAGWLLRGPDLSVVLRRTPLLVEDTKELRQYYEELPLERRLDILIGLGVTSELLQSSGILTREQYPKFRRFLDVYSVAVGAACLLPREVFYNIHRAFWILSTRQALIQAREPVRPLLLSSENRAAIMGAVDSVTSAVSGGSTSGTGTLAGGGGQGSSIFGGVGAAVLLATAASVALVGGAAWMSGEDSRRRLWLHIRRWVLGLLQGHKRRLPPAAEAEPPAATSATALQPVDPPLRPADVAAAAAAAMTASQQL